MAWRVQKQIVCTGRLLFLGHFLPSHALKETKRGIRDTLQFYCTREAFSSAPLLGLSFLALPQVHAQACLYMVWGLVYGWQPRFVLHSKKVAYALLIGEISCCWKLQVF